jgi:hypothetical protein
MTGPGETATRLVLLVAGVLTLGALVLVARSLCRRWQRKPAVQAFSMEEIEALRDSGQISQAEFARLRAAALRLDSRTEEKGETQSSVGLELDDDAEDAEEGDLRAGEGV